MKILCDNGLSSLGNAALRCGHWVIMYRNNKGNVRKHGKEMLGYHEGKWYAYMYTLCLANWAKMESFGLAMNGEKFIREFYKDWVWIFPKIYLKSNIVFLMKPEVFEKCLTAPEKENSVQLIKETRKMCKIIK